MADRPPAPPTGPRPAARLHIAVIGGGNAGSHDLDLAEKAGRAVAQAGAVLVCGGLGGVMEAACRGAEEAGGLTVGILPGTDRAEANPHVAVAVATGLGEIRNAVVVQSVDAVVAVGGEYGTLSEIALALRAGTPVVGIGTWHLARGHEEAAREARGVARDTADPIVRVGDPDEAVQRAVELARGRHRGPRP